MPLAQAVSRRPARSQDCQSDYRWGLDRFIEEAQTLAKFNHTNIVRVYRYFRANNTGYMVLHFEEGQSLKSWLKSLGRAPRQKELDAIVAPLLEALELIHKADFLHRDIAPDNIIIRKDGTPVLIDFGSARGEILAHSKTVSALVKPGYSPYEQYAETSRQQGPWTDIYALGATLYHAVSGKRPTDSPSRMVKDELIPAREAALSAYRPSFLKAVDHALALGVSIPAPIRSRMAWSFARTRAGESRAGSRARNRSTAAMKRPEPVPARGGRREHAPCSAATRRAGAARQHARLPGRIEEAPFEAQIGSGRGAPTGGNGRRGTTTACASRNQAGTGNSRCRNREARPAAQHQASEAPEEEGAGAEGGKAEGSQAQERAEKGRAEREAEEARQAAPSSASAAAEVGAPYCSSS